MLGQHQVIASTLLALNSSKDVDDGRGFSRVGVGPHVVVAAPTRGSWMTQPSTILQTHGALQLVLLARPSHRASQGVKRLIKPNVFSRDHPSLILD